MRLCMFYYVKPNFINPFPFPFHSANHFQYLEHNRCNGTEIKGLTWSTSHSDTSHHWQDISSFFLWKQDLKWSSKRPIHAPTSSLPDTVSNTLNSTLCNNTHYNDTMNTLRIIQVSLWAPAVTIALYALFFTIGWYLCCQGKGQQKDNNKDNIELHARSWTTS